MRPFIFSVLIFVILSVKPVTGQELAKSPQQKDSTYSYLWNSDNLYWYTAGKTIYTNGANLYTGITYTKDITTGYFDEYKQTKTNWEVQTDGSVNILTEKFIYNSTLKSYVPQSKIVNNKDKNGNDILFETHYWDTSSETWIPEQRSEEKYNAAGKKTLIAEYPMWDSNLSIWIGSTKEEISYNIDNNVTQTVSFIWDSNNNSWINESKWSTYYTESGLLDYKTYKKWDPNTGSFLLKSKTIYQYEQLGLLANETVTIWNEQSSVWENSTRTTYAYNPDQNLSETLTEKWNVTGGNWNETQKETYAYDGNKNMIENILYTSPGTTIPDTKYEFAFDLNGNRILSARHLWVAALETWETQNKEVMAFDELNQQTLLEIYEIDIDTKQLKGIHRETREYNNFGNLTIYTGFIWDSNSSEWLNLVQNYHYYSEIVTSVIQKRSKAISTYPNPFGDHLIIDFNNLSGPILLEIYDLQGNQVFFRDFPSNEGRIEISTSGLKKGIYLYRIINENKVETGKMIKN